MSYEPERCFIRRVVVAVAAVVAAAAAAACTSPTVEQQCERRGDVQTKLLSLSMMI